MNYDFEQHQPDWLDKCCDHIFESLKSLPNENGRPITLEQKKNILYQVIDYISTEMAENAITRNQWAGLDLAAKQDRLTETVGTYQEPLYIKEQNA